MIEVDVALDRGAFRLDAAFRSEAGVTALFGPSGSGKSTIIALIAGLLRPDSGRIAIAGRVLVDTSRRIFVAPHRRRAGLVFQDALLFPHLDVRRNLSYGRWFAPRGMRRASLEQVVDVLGIGHLLDRRPESLSGGERQRVAIGRALLSDPDILLLDEPLASLDRPRRLEIMPYLQRLHADFGVPMLYVSHAVNEVARLAGEVVLIGEGQVRGQGPPAAVLSSGEAVEGPENVVSVLNVRVAERDLNYGLTVLRHPAGRIAAIETSGRLGDRIRIVVRAADVTLALEPPARMSARTHLRGTIAEIAPFGAAGCIVSLDLAGGDRLAAFITRRSVDDLALAPGAMVFAVIKAVDIREPRALARPID